MRWLALFLLVGCGVWIDPKIPKDVISHARDCARQSFYKTTIPESFFDNIDVWLLPETTCDRAGCYTAEGEIQLKNYTDGSYNKNDYCLLLCHEYVHAIGDQLFGSVDSDHVKWDYYSSNPHCGELML